MKLPRRFLTVVLAIVAGLLLLAGCGGGGGGGKELGLDEYFQQFDAIEESMKTNISALEAEESQGVVGEDVEATRHYVDGYRGVVAQGLNDVKALKPPAETRDAQDKFVAALSSMISLWDDLRDQLAGVGTASEMQELLTAVQSKASWLDASQQFTDACRELQGIATDNGIDVTLDCE